MGMLLEAVDVDADVTGALRWRWLLSDEETGNPLADHPVDLDPRSVAVARFRDLFEYTRHYAVPDRRTKDGARFLAEAGEWAGGKLLGGPIGAAIVADAPVTVRVRVPKALSPVLLWPLELAHVAGRPLATYEDVTLVYDIAPDAPAQRKAEPGEALRMLAVFSQPTRTSPLALRRERYELTRLVRRIAARERAVVELQVVQYGVTRERLRQIAGSGDGWDVLHLSGHGTGGAFWLEKADGSPDPVATGDLVALLRPARRRLRLAVASACESAADTTAQTLRLLGLPEQAEALETAENAEAGLAEASVTSDGAPAAQIPGLARALVRDLDCAVVAMRYPVTDEFAIAFGGSLYDHLLSRTHRHPVDVAVSRAVAEATGPGPSAALPPVSLVTPGVFGARAVGLAVAVPRGEPVIDPAGQRMAYFPGEPPRFVGRAEAMARAGAALAPGSGRTAVLLHGMAGAGKTACALELAYRHQDSFAAAAFWQAPTRDGEWASALPDLAGRLDIQLADYGFTMASHIGTAADLEAFLPRLRAVMAATGVLLILDNLETLLTPDGGWRDPRWEKLITALTSHDGESRVILTSRIAPAGLGEGTDGLAGQVTGGLPGSAESGGVVPGPGAAAGSVVTLPVHALSRDESAVLARELPNLRALLHADGGPIRAGTAAEAGAEAERQRIAADRDRVRRVLRVVQGHPKLLEFADAAAADRARLDAQLTAAEDAATRLAATGNAPAGHAPAGDGPTGYAPTGYAPTGQLDAFFRDGRTSLNAGQFLDALTGWTTAALSVLAPGARLMAEFVACLEDGDRRSDVIDANWADLWRRLDRPGDPPAPGPLLDALASATLIEAEAFPVPGADGQEAGGDHAGAGDQAGARTGPGAVAYRVHPGVAAAIAAAAGPGIRDAADAELAAFWVTVAVQASERQGGEDSGLVVRAGLAAAPYLLRRGDWDTAGSLLEDAVNRDGSPGTVQAAVPGLRRVAAATGTLAHTRVLARALRSVDPGEAERLLRGALAAAAGDYWTASAAAGTLVNLLLDAGHLAEALAVAGQKDEYTRRAGLGPWTQLLDQAQRLQVLGLMGERARVLAEVAELRAAMAELPARPAASEAANPWNVREVILGTGHASALATGDWQGCLDLNAEIAASQRQRGAGVHEVTRTRFNDAGPLIRLGRVAEAGRLLAECQRVFEDHADTTPLARVLGTRADLEATLGHRQAAADLARAALRLFYARPEPRDIAVSHHNLAIYLGALGGDRAGQRAHRLAAALIDRLAGDAHDLAGAVRALAGELREDDDGGAGLPSTVAEVTVIAERTEGVRLGGLLAALEPDPRAVQDALTEILHAAADMPPDEGQPDIASQVGQWEPVIADIAAACRAGQEPPPGLLEFLDVSAEDPDWAALAAVLRRVLAGERGEPLLDGLDPIDTAIARELLARLT